MAPKNATTGAQNCYSPLCPPASKHTTDGPQESEYSLICVAAIVVSTTALVRSPAGASRKNKIFAIVGLVLGVVYTLMALVWAVTGRT